MEGIDYNIFSGKLNSDAIDLDFNNSLLQKFFFSKSNSKWDVESLDLTQYCKSSKKVEDKRQTNINLVNRESNNNINFINNNSTLVNNNNLNDESISNITEEVFNIDENIFSGNLSIRNTSSKCISIKNDKKYDKIKKLNNSSLSVNSFENFFDSKPIIEKKPIRSEETFKNINSRLINNTENIFSLDMKKNLENLNELKFMEKVNKLRLHKNNKNDFSSKKIEINKQKLIYKEKNFAINDDNKNFTIHSNNTNIKVDINKIMSFPKKELRLNIKEEDIKIKENIQNLISSNKTIFAIKNIEKMEKKIEFLKDSREKKEDEIKKKINNFSSNFTIENITSTVLKVKNKNERYNNI